MFRRKGPEYFQMEEQPKNSFYDILGVSPKATGDEIKNAYRQLALKFHPDRNPGNAEAKERFMQATEAYEVLRDSDKRRQYDNRSSSENWEKRRTASDLYGLNIEELLRYLDASKAVIDGMLRDHDRKFNEILSRTGLTSNSASDELRKARAEYEKVNNDYQKARRKFNEKPSPKYSPEDYKRLLQRVTNEVGSAFADIFKKYESSLSHDDLCEQMEDLLRKEQDKKNRQ